MRGWEREGDSIGERRRLRLGRERVDSDECLLLLWQLYLYNIMSVIACWALLISRGISIYLYNCNIMHICV